MRKPKRRRNRGKTRRKTSISEAQYNGITINDNISRNTKVRIPYIARQRCGVEEDTRQTNREVEDAVRLVTTLPLTWLLHVNQRAPTEIMITMVMDRKTMKDRPRGR